MADRTNAQVTVVPDYDGVLPRPVGRGNDYYAKVRTMRRDPTIRLARWFSVAALVEAGWSVETREIAPAGAKELLTAQMDRLHRNLVQTALYGLADFGWQTWEKRFAWRKDGLVWCPSLKPLLHDWTELLVLESDGTWCGVRQNPLTISTHGDWEVFLSTEECMLCNMDVEGTDLYGEPLSWAVEQTYDEYTTAKNVAEKYDRKIAGSHWVIYYPRGTTMYNGVNTDNGEIAADLARMLSSVSSIALPRSVVEVLDQLSAEMASNEAMQWKVELLSDKSSTSTAILDRLKYLDSLKARAYGFPERAFLEGKFGTKAEAGDHADLAIVGLEARHASLCEQINLQLVDQTVRLNYGPDLDGAVYLKPSPLSDDSKEFLRKIYETVLSASPEELAGLDVSSIRQRLQVPTLPTTALAVWPDEQQQLLPMEEPYAEPIAFSAGFDPNQPRDKYGKWTAAGADTGLNAPAGTGTASSPKFPQDWQIIKNATEAIGPDGELKVVQELGGSTHAKLVEDQNGQRFVMKVGASPDHIRNEQYALEQYRKLGVPVPRSKLYEDKTNQPFLLTEFISGVRLDDAEAEDLQYGTEDLKRNFVADVLMANWDVTGAHGDNIIIADDGTAMRIDAGGAMYFRAQGTPKFAFTKDNPETVLYDVETMRQAHTTAGSVFGHIPDEDIKEQLQAINEAVAGQSLDETLVARLNVLNKHFGVGGGAEKLAAEVEKPALKKSAGGKNAAATKEQIAQAYQMYKNGSKHKATAEALGLTEKQVATLIWKVNHGKVQIEEELAKLEGKSKAPAAAETPQSKSKLPPPKASAPPFTPPKKPQPIPSTPSYQPAWSAPAMKKSIAPTSHAESWPIPADKPRASVLEPDVSALEKQASKWYSSLNDHLQDAVGNYTGSGYDTVNKYLRTGKIWEGANSDYIDELKKQADAIQTALKGAPKPPPPSVVWRGIGNPNRPEYQKLIPQLKPGAVIELAGFQSTSIRPAKALGSADLNSAHPTLFEIVPKSGAYVGQTSSVSSEQEFLMPHAAKYKVAGIANINYGSHGTHLTVQLEQQ